MRKIVFLTILVFLSIFSFSPARGGYITIETKTSTTIAGNTMKISVETKNKGNEPAYNVEIISSVQSDTRSSKIKEILNVEETYKSEMDFNLRLDNPGRYAAVIYVNYTDANQYPFSAISCLQFSFGENVSSQVFAKSADVEMNNKGKFLLNIKNLSEKDKEVQIRLIVPKELSPDNSLKKVSLKARSGEEIRFTINNFSALPGSNYQVYSIMEYIESGKHYTSIVPGTIKIEKDEPFYLKYKIVLIIISAILVILFLIFQFKPKSK
ncbi:MAG: hypothetical protein A3C43_00775 [Candidatus Schekmanbacteria bacterium RIFCSPHIGHO2_02_FULL_38_11]|uniref:CARDB domain-containing protein n=1 Tax=Candidatus Schekmanbacteria bacterium RIFCSPLOWO2_12_FULL_38_15 TaxID=1817883 RepID=A0A1F7SMX2_9BACT|nr:MAG: hypothetical protein A2043_07820 [Candidatus Schekmanbacteria bacterium GWA2_38_9]OGL50007.1 MAG: hypothetical protein A3C43_00775 [Candidatus Schekmanbacteria bacterium RIFCSPHIGHO2_02_FULL_38_11]OGL51121.1 MAG: hypothetical protein A3H37_08850 [Candidatus Schekmanbacteria bacterium RIFCSPLOWO2_02_FULL_38_14]OGL55121.1 MAG: hypothetical protein A3G31_02675 [Candidatus Schekmanbacteria bacterium RIFCSPLOWO2_12_FULL_38_15]